MGELGASLSGHQSIGAINNLSKQAFSLVELSIVLVILGLLTGGILSGQSLIRAAELRSITTEYQRYTAATFNFRDRYLALPGDFKDATKFWNTAATCPGTFAAPATSTATCNGDGSGIIETPSATNNERYLYWHHLANAGLIEGTYTAVPAGAATQNIQGNVNIPQLRLATAAIAVANQEGVVTQFFKDGLNGHQYHILSSAFGSITTNSNILSAEEAWNIDTKVDDGRPGLGNVRGRKAGVGTSPNCSSSSDPLTAEYQFSVSGLTCTLQISTGF